MNIGDIGGLEVDFDVLDPDIIQRTELFVGIEPVLMVEMGRDDDGVGTAYIRVAGVQPEGVSDFVEGISQLLGAINITVADTEEED